MAEVPDETSTQNSVAIALEAMQSEGTPFRIETTKGEEVIEFTPEMDYQLVVYSSPNLEPGESYNIFTGSTQVSNFTVSSAVTTVGTFNEFIGKGGMGGKQRP